MKNLIGIIFGIFVATYVMKIFYPDKEDVSAKSAQVEIQYVKPHEEFVIGDFKYKFTEGLCKEGIGKGFMLTRASKGATYCLFYYTIKNEGNKSQVVSTENMIFKDSLGREFEPSIDASAALYFENNTMRKQLHPSLETKAVIAFEVPKDVINSAYEVVVIDHELFSSKKAILKMNKKGE